jgi:RNA polymerase sigma-70 factor (ECF subfamily)
VNQEDRQDIDAARNGDHDAYRRLVERYEADISRLMWRFTQKDYVCEELVQEVFVEAFFSIDSYKYRAPFVYWLKTIATRVGYRLWKRQAKERQFVDLESSAEPEAPGEGPKEEDVQRIVHHLLDRLAPADRLVLTLMYLDKCSVKQIAEHMGWNQAVVKTRAYRARKKLRAIADKEQIWDELEWTA